MFEWLSRWYNCKTVILHWFSRGTWTHSQNFIHFRHLKCRRKWYLWENHRLKSHFKLPLAINFLVHFNQTNVPLSQRKMSFRFITFHFNPEHLRPLSVREVLIILKVAILLFQYGILCSSGHPDESVSFGFSALEQAYMSFSLQDRDQAQKSDPSRWTLKLFVPPNFQVFGSSVSN